MKIIHEGHKDDKCKSCFSQSQHLKRHIRTIHKGHEDYKCESCGKFFSQNPCNST